jgi:hypothetical protein
MIPHSVMASQITAAVLAEREACARLIDEEIALNSGEQPDQAEARRYRGCLRLLAAAVRTRGNP